MINQNAIKTVKSVNFHITESCNMKCKFCFSRYSVPHNAMPDIRDIFFIIRELASNGVEKITFVGGEPLTYQLLPEIINYSKDFGLVTMIVTNGYYIDRSFVLNCGESIDWIGFSIDSLNSDENISSGRAHSGKTAMSNVDYFNKIKLVKDSGIRLKINTVVSSFNKNTDLNDFIRQTTPERWKIFQSLALKDVNTFVGESFTVTDDEFNSFVQRHIPASIYTDIISESNELMIGSYIMIDPAGRLYDNIQGWYRISEPIHKVGFKVALNQISFFEDKFISRGGNYNWK